MPVDRFFLESSLIKGKTVVLEGQEYQHLQKVTRHTPGDIVELINGKNQLAKARIEKFDKKGAFLEILEAQTSPSQEPSLILVQAIPKLPKLELILEKCIELQVSEIWLFPGMHSEKVTFSPNQLERLKFISVSAIKQCGRLDLPPIVFKESLEMAFPGQGSCFFGDVSPGAQSLLSSLQNTPERPIHIFIGPESGFHEKEVALLKKRGAKGTSLLDSILRTETAAIASVAIASHVIFDKSRVT